MNLSSKNNLLEVFFEQYAKQNKDDLFLKWLKFPSKKFSWKETNLSICKLSIEIKKNIKKGDRCLLISEDRPEWLISDLAIMLAGGITVPAYTTYTEKDYEFIIDDCQPSILVVSSNDLFKKIKYISLNKQFINKIIIFDDVDKNKLEHKIIKLKDILNSKENFFVETTKLKLNRKDIACIIYTSGTGGNPKGVMLSHGGILSNCEGAVEMLKPILSKRTNFLTWLPLSHSYEHTVQFVQISIGAKIYYAEGIDKLIKNMSESKPEIMTAVPRFYQNLYQKINNTFKKQSGFKLKLINLTIKLGIKDLEKQKFTFNEKVINKICDFLVRKKIKNQFGGNLKAFVSGGAALDKDIGNFLNSIGLPTLQGYGLTEASPVVSCNPKSYIKVDTVGIPFKGNQIKINEDGEILIKGENVMLGYWGQPEATNEVIKNDWLYTGDIGEISEGYLKITDRKKDIIVTTGGDNISPAKIENKISSSSEIEQCLVYGDKKSYLVALIVPIKETTKEKIDIILAEINKSLSLIEKIKKFELINENFTIENGLLTPTMKVKRNKVIKKYKNTLENLY
tara:strand:- start:8244 stop:9941 length:1698 start_codon:yes stop_codon:yes gene_type:complete